MNGKKGKTVTNYGNNPHDSYFIEVFSNKKSIITFLNTILPEKVLKQIDLSSIEFDLKSYLNEKLSKRTSDLVVKTIIKTDKDKKNLDTDIYFLFEHKSYKDNSILLQLLRYMYLMWEKDEAEKQPLRVIIPIVFYHGKTGWNIPTNFVEKFEVSDDIKKHLLNFSYLLFDTKDLNIKETKYKKLTENIKLTAQILLMKNIFAKNIEKLEEVLKFWNKNGLVQDKDFLEKSLTYIMFTNDYSQDEIIELLEKNIEEGGKIMPSLGQRLLDKGKAEGMQEGMQQGMHKGMHKGMTKGRTEERKELVVKMFNKGYKTGEISDITGLSENEIETILKIN